MLTNRYKLFIIQAIFTIFSIVLIGFVLTQDVSKEFTMLKVVLSPFSAILMLFFLLFIFNKVIKNFDDQEYKAKVVIVSFIILAIVLVATIFGINTIMGFLRSIDKIIFILAMILCIVIFFLLRIGNIYTMATITGMAQAIIIYVIFIY